jgi:hypothetical protein
MASIFNWKKCFCGTHWKFVFLRNAQKFPSFFVRDVPNDDEWGGRVTRFEAFNT